MRPSCKKGISIETSLPLRALPRARKFDRGLPQYRWKRRCVRRIPDAAWGDRANLVDHLAAAIVIDRMGGAQFARQREAVCMHVDDDDRIAAGDLCGHQG